MSDTGEPGRFVLQVPAGDNLPRLVCEDCGFVRYENPRVVVGSVAVHGDRVLLCRRAIEPRKGYWTLPAGFLELNESSAQGALREAREEAFAELALEGLLAIYDIPRISQIQLIYRARLLSPDVRPGPESQEVELFAWDDIPWDDLAFPSVHWALRHWRDSRGRETFPARGNPEDGL